MQVLERTRVVHTTLPCGTEKIIKGTVKRITWTDRRNDEVVADGFEYIDASGKMVKIKARDEVIVFASA